MRQISRQAYKAHPHCINVNQVTATVSIVDKATNATPKEIREIRVIRENPRFRELPPREYQNIVMLSAVFKLIFELPFTGES